MIRFSLISALTFFIFNNVFAQEREVYHRIFIDGSPTEISKIAQTYFIDEGYRTKEGLTTEIPSTTINQMREDGVPFKILIEDMEQFYANRLADKSYSIEKALTCTSSNISDPTNFHLGSMGGYYTYEELLQELDEMENAYPNIFKGKTQIGTFQTHQNRPIYYVKISDNPNTDESEPRVLYASHIHAREAITGMQLIYYMWYILENYDTDPEIKYLVDNSEMYFIPVLNPDGVKRNQTNSPNGGGMHRKNLRSVGTTNPGVDLNRNFDIQWGTSGVSNNTNNDTYPGPSAASEPETKAFKWFAEEKDFVASLCHHSYGDLLLFPFGYANVQTPDQAFFENFTAEFVTVNGFENTQSVNLYPAAGDTDDWLYTTSANKPKVYAMTPESGTDNDGFWPAQNRILPMCRANLKMNTDLARFATKTAFVNLSKSNNYYVTGLSDFVKFDFKRFGLENGTFEISLVPLSPEILSVGANKTFTNPNQLQVYEDSIQFTLDPSIQVGTELNFEFRVDNGDVVFTKNVSMEYGLGNLIFYDDASSLNNYTTAGGNWFVTNNTYVSAPSSITDSPNGNYTSNLNKRIYTTNPISLSGSNLTNAALTYWTKWNIEKGYDYAQVSACSPDINSCTPLCGKFTVLGNNNQDPNQPLYDGVQTTWVKEEISLNDFIGSDIQIFFRLKTDGNTNRDGFYFDDLRVYLGYSTLDIENNYMENIQVYPNPTESNLNIVGYDGDWMLIDASGKVVMQSQGNSVDISRLSQGLYVLKTGKVLTKIIKK